MAGRTFAIGDIHGCAPALSALLESIDPKPSDTIVTLGDYVDRGPESSEVLNILTELVSRCRLIPLLGNHEIMMTSAMNSRRDFEFWLFNGGNATLQSYGGDINFIPMHHRTFLNHCQRYYETDDYIFVHAAYDPQLPMDRQIDEILFWQHINDDHVPLPHFSGKKVICGHTPQLDGDIRDLGHVKIIDTFCYGDKWLTALEVETGELIQARADGYLREMNGKPKADTVESKPPPPEESDDELEENTPEGLPVETVIDLADSSDEPDHAAPEDFVSKRSPLELSGKQLKNMLDTVGDYLAEHLDTLDQARVRNHESGVELVDEIRESIPNETTDLKPILDDLFSKYIPASFNSASPGYLAYIPGGGLPESAVADLIAAVTNRYVTVWNAAPVMAQIESTVISWFNKMIGFPSAAGGFLTTGGSLATLSAILVARVRDCGNDFSRARLYLSDQTHHCVHKAAFMAGIPKGNLRLVSVDDRQRIDVGELQQMIDDDRIAGLQPLMIFGNAGTTNTGAVDDLMALAKLAKQEQIWFHVDAAYGGFFALTKRGKQVLNGIQHADSVALDPHKGMFLPYGTGCLLVKRRDDLLPAFQFTSAYMPELTGDRTRDDFCEISPELSRDNRGLRIWLPLKLHGIDVFRELLDEKLDLALWSYERIKELAKELTEKNGKLSIQVASPQLSVVPFNVRHADFDQQQNNDLNRRWLEAVNDTGRVMITSTMMNSRYVNRICVLSFRTHMERMEEFLEILKATLWEIIQDCPK